MWLQIDVFYLPKLVEFLHMVFSPRTLYANWVWRIAGKCETRPWQVYDKGP